jgi:quercetin dioxygenase-like cupin family protein
MDRPEVRVSRVEIAPSAVRSVHKPSMMWVHLWIPISGKLEITIGSAKPMEAASGQPFFLQKGTPHEFRNVGTAPAAVMEIFVEDAGQSTLRPLHQRSRDAQRDLSRGETDAARLLRAPDGERTLVTQPELNSEPLDLIVNWPALLKRQ